MDPRVKNWKKYESLIIQREGILTFPMHRTNFSAHKYLFSLSICYNISHILMKTTARSYSAENDMDLHKGRMYGYHVQGLTYVTRTEYFSISTLICHQKFYGLQIIIFNWMYIWALICSCFFAAVLWNYHEIVMIYHILWETTTYPEWSV